MSSYNGIPFEPWSDSATLWVPEWRRRDDGAISRKKIAYSDFEDLQFLGRGNWYIDLAIVVNGHGDFEAFEGSFGLTPAALIDFFGQSFPEVILTRFTSARRHTRRTFWVAEVTFERKVRVLIPPSPTPVPDTGTPIAGFVWGAGENFTVGFDSAQRVQSPDGRIDVVHWEFGDGKIATQTAPDGGWLISDIPVQLHIYPTTDQPVEYVVNTSVDRNGIQSPNFADVVVVGPTPVAPPEAPPPDPTPTPVPVTPPPTAPPPSPTGVMFGVNIAGAEFGAAIPGVFGIDYRYPTP